MPYEITWEPAGVYRRYFGRVTHVERVHSLDAICSDARFDELRYTITDYLDVDAYEIRPSDTEEMAAMHIAPLERNPHIVLTAVATDVRIIAAIGHFKSLNFVSQPYRIFSSAAAAREWIAAMSLSTRRWP